MPGADAELEIGKWLLGESSGCLKTQVKFLTVFMNLTIQAVKDEPVPIPIGIVSEKRHNAIRKLK